MDFLSRCTSNVMDVQWGVHGLLMDDYAELEMNNTCGFVSVRESDNLANQAFAGNLSLYICAQVHAYRYKLQGG